MKNLAFYSHPSHPSIGPSSQTQLNVQCQKTTKLFYKRHYLGVSFVLKHLNVIPKIADKAHLSKHFTCFYLGDEP